MVYSGFRPRQASAWGKNGDVGFFYNRVAVDGDEDWSPTQATGEPDTPECGDNPSTWASLMGSEEEWLEVYFESAVVPSEVNIYQTYGATQITKVELLDTSHNYHEIYTGEPSETDCPFVLKIDSTN